ncbi:MAG TPA: DUF177 domain-containing protein [Bacteroidia bacterium]|nr:DUF177 domain-containing protein [Bacteroidia bacterium]HNP97597.1 DUF177 domain-containing protein [Bacteroidia bacterium]
MSAPRDFVINFGSLGRAEHEFEFEVNDSFFQRFENSIVQKGQVDVLVVLEKKEHMLLLDFTIEGRVTVQCDRCLEDLDLDIESYNELVVKIGEESGEEAEDVIVLSNREYELDLAQFIYEYISVIIPLRNVHEDENGNPDCDPEILKELEKHLSHEEEEEKPPSDPRWDGLKGINLN